MIQDCDAAVLALCWDRASLLRAGVNAINFDAPPLSNYSRPAPKDRTYRLDISG